MPLFAKKGSETRVIAVVDIGSSSAGAALVLLDRNGPPSVLAQVRVDTPIEKTRSAEGMAKHVLMAAKDALARLSAAPEAKQAPGFFSRMHESPKTAWIEHVDHVAVFVPAPWSRLFLHTARMARTKPIKASAGLIERMVADYMRREKTDKDNESIIERSAVGIRINGYAVGDIPKGVDATQIDLTVISATAPRTFISGLTSAVRDTLGHRPTISFHPTNVAISHVLSVIRSEEGDYLLSNTEGELTELLLVREHIPAAAATAPHGCTTLLRTLQVHADMARAEAASALSLARDAHSPMAKKLQTTLTAAQKECAGAFRAAVVELVRNFGAPKTIYTLGLGSEGQWYAEAVASAPFMKELFPTGVRVESVTSTMLAPYIKERAPLEGSRHKGADLFLALEAIYCDARFDEHQAFNFKLADRR